MANEKQPEELSSVRLENFKINAKGELLFTADVDNYDEDEIDRLKKELESTNNQLNE